MEANAKAYRNNIREAIFEILSETEESYAKNGAALDGENDLRDAPEYFLTVKIAEGLANKFKSLRYDLEYSVKKIVEHYFSDSETTTSQAVLEGAPDWARFGQDGKGRFDLVLTGAQSKRIPRYIVEVKRGPRFAHDIERMVYLASLQPDKNRWNYGFVVTLLRRKTLEQAQQAVTSALEGVFNTHEVLRTHPVVQKIKRGFNRSVQQLGKGKLDGEHLFGFVFIVDLSDPHLAE